MAEETIEGRMLTLQTLADHNACWDYREPFNDKFDREVLVTREAAVEQATEWDWDWAADKLLTPEGYEEYRAIVGPAMDQYRILMEPFWTATREAYDKGEVAGRAVRLEHPKPSSEDAWQAAFQVRREHVNPAYEAEDAARLVHNRALCEVKALAFATIYIKEGK